jgi:putative oxidoreductase
MSGLAETFDITNGVVVLRLICGLFFIPHIVGKFTEPATLNFFKTDSIRRRPGCTLPASSRLF